MNDEDQWEVAGANTRRAQKRIRPRHGAEGGSESRSMMPIEPKPLAGVAYAVQTAVNGGNELLIFVPPKASDRGLPMAQASVVPTTLPSVDQRSPTAEAEYAFAASYWFFSSSITLNVYSGSPASSSRERRRPSSR